MKDDNWAGQVLTCRYFRESLQFTQATFTRKANRALSADPSIPEYLVARIRWRWEACSAIGRVFLTRSLARPHVHQGASASPPDVDELPHALRESRAEVDDHDCRGDGVGGMLVGSTIPETFDAG